jgi:hypothetical protein
MRTTIELPDELLSAARSRAAQEGVSLREFFIDAVRQRLMPARKIRRPPPRVGSTDGPPIPDLTREQIDEAMFS